MDEFGVTFFDDAASFRDRVAPWLAADPVRSTVVATAVDRAVAVADRGEDPTGGLALWWFASVEDGAGAVVGVAMRTAPFHPHPVYVLAMPDAAADALATALLERDEPLGGVSGARPSADRCAEQIASATGASTEVVMHTRLFELGALVPPVAVPGRLRPVRPAEAFRALDWMRRFLVDAEAQGGRAAHPSRDPGAITIADAHRRIRDRTLWFWVDADDTPVHLTGANPPSYGVCRIGPVYTPPEQRGRGYATAAVAAVSRNLRDAGARPILFTDQANPTSNRIYVALGYRAVVDTVEIALR